MSASSSDYKPFIKESRQADNYHGFDLKRLLQIEPFLKFLHRCWWRVETEGFNLLPAKGPALIVGNTSGIIPWAALMLIYTLMSESKNSRRVNILADLSWVRDERLFTALIEIGFVPWSADNFKRLIAKGELVAIFPESSQVLGKTITMRNRLTPFDWSKFLPAVENKVPIYPLATLGLDESNLVLFNLESFAKLLNLKAFPVSAFFPWLPFPFNLATLPISWKMHLLKPIAYDEAKDREHLQEIAKREALFAEGEIQAEINRLLRTRHRVL